MSEPITDAVRIAAEEAFALARKTGTRTMGHCLREALEAASPLIRAEERQRIIAATSVDDPAPENVRLGLYRLAAADGALAERERIAAGLIRRADALDEATAGSKRQHDDQELIAITLRNTAWAIVHGDHAENLREPDPAPTGECP